MRKPITDKIYPDYDHIVRNVPSSIIMYSHEYRTLIRKFHPETGKYYLWPVLVIDYIEPHLNPDISRFLQEVYKAITFGVVPVKAVDLHGDPIVPEDENQEHEAVRIHKRYGK